MREIKADNQTALSPLPHHQYEDHEEVVVWMNTVGPYHNRQVHITTSPCRSARALKVRLGITTRLLGRHCRGWSWSSVDWRLDSRVGTTHDCVCIHFVNQSMPQFQGEFPYYVFRYAILPSRHWQQQWHFVPAVVYNMSVYNEYV